MDLSICRPASFSHAPLSSGMHSSHAASVARGLVQQRLSLLRFAHTDKGQGYDCVREDPDVYFLPGSEFTRISRITLER